MLRTARNGLPACDWRIWSVWRSLFVNSGSRTEATFFSSARMRFCALITAASVWTGLRDLSLASRWSETIYRSRPCASRQDPWPIPLIWSYSRIRNPHRSQILKDLCAWVSQASLAGEFRFAILASLRIIAHPSASGMARILGFHYDTLGSQWIVQQVNRFRVSRRIRTWIVRFHDASACNQPIVS